MLYLWLPFDYEGYKSAPAKEDTYKGRTGEVLMEPGHLIHIAYQYVHQAKSFSEPQFPEIILEVHYVGTINWIIDHMMELNV